jgi:6-phosphogluconolactonase
MKRGFYIVACAAASEGGGIFRYRFDEAGVPQQLGCNPIDDANWISYSPDRQYLYSTCSMGDSSAVAAFKVNPDMSLVELNRMSAAGKAGCYVTTDPSGKFLFCANYLSGNVSVFSLNADGSIKERLRNIQHTGSGPNLPRQDAAHAHFASITPDNQYLIVIDLGIDAVKLYPFDSRKGIDEDRVRTFQVEPAGSGPRHLIFDQSGRIAYLLDELGNTVHALAYAAGEFKTIGIATTMPKVFTGATKAAAIRLSEDERFLFASNRGYDSIAVFELDGKGGMKPHDLLLCGGESPRDINFLPGMETFASANEFSDSVFFFDYDAAKGKLTPNGNVLTHKRPLAIYW